MSSEKYIGLDVHRLAPCPSHEGACCLEKPISNGHPRWVVLAGRDKEQGN